MKQTPPTAPPMAQTLTHIMAANHRAATAAIRLTARSMQGFAEMQTHLVDFAAKRLDRDMDMARRLAACTGPGDVLALGHTACAEAMADYADEAVALARVGAGALGDIAMPEPTDGVALGD